MPEVLGQSWFDANDERPYPLSERATRSDDDGQFMPNTIITDLRIWFPASLGDVAFLGGVFTGPNLVSVVICASVGDGSSPSEYVPLASVSLSSVRSGVVYRLNPLADGVAGMIVFGSGARPSAAKSYKFSSYLQSELTSRSARKYTPPGVISLRRSGSSSGLSGDVRISGSGDMEIVGESLSIDGSTVTAAVFNIVDSDVANLLRSYAGPCGGRPESGTCEFPGIEFINTVSPDCQGNIKITFRGDVVVTPYYDGGGLVLDYPIGLSEACTIADRLPGEDGRLPNEYDDQCANPYDGSPFGDDDNLGENPGGETSEAINCSDIPYVDKFQDQSLPLPYHFWTNIGSFSWIEIADKPSPWFDYSSPGTGYVLRSTTAAYSICFWDDCSVYSPIDVLAGIESSGWGKCLKIETGFRINGVGVAGLVLTGSTAYVSMGKNLADQSSISIVVDLTNEFVHLRGSIAGIPYNIDSVYSPGLSAYENQWVSISAELYMVTTNSASVYFEVRDNFGNIILADTFTGIATKPGPFGIVARHGAGNTDFAWFRVTDVLTGPAINC